jgi:hypothetical protein
MTFDDKGLSKKTQFILDKLEIDQYIVVEL